MDSTNLNLEQAVEEIYRIITEKDKRYFKDRKKHSLKELPKAEPVKRGKKLSPIRMFLYKILRIIVMAIFKIYYNLSF